VEETEEEDGETEEDEGRGKMESRGRLEMYRRKIREGSVRRQVIVF